MTDPAGVQINTDASTSRIAATLNLAPVNLPSGSTIVARYGTISTAPGTANHRTAFVDDGHFAALTSLQTTPTADPKVAVSVSNSRVNGAIPTITNNSFIVTAGGTQSLLPAAIPFCRCQYLQWVFFQSNYVTNNGNQTDRINLGTWAAGPLASPADMPQSGSATYSGHAIGTAYTFNVPNSARGSAYYVSAGGFTNQWNFATRSGNLAISNFDGATYAGRASAANGRDYIGTLAGAGRSVAIGGSFFKGGGDPARETGGQFRITGPGYQAGGIFAGAK
jgi:hypothetical protein